MWFYYFGNHSYSIPVDFKNSNSKVIHNLEILVKFSKGKDKVYFDNDSIYVEDIAAKIKFVVGTSK